MSARSPLSTVKLAGYGLFTFLVFGIAIEVTGRPVNIIKLQVITMDRIVDFSIILPL